MADEKPGQTLQATALVHEAYVRLVGDQQFSGRGHFFAAAAEAMRRILVESARRKKRLRHGGDRQRVELSEPAVRDKDTELLDLDDALSGLAAEDPSAAEVAKLHVFAGLSVEAAADLLGVSRATAYRHWNYAKAWLRCEIGGRDFSPNR
jgi:RNA polymerase sigma factor (TIGR02999 family)